jgi:hypothetical protein
MKLSVGAFSFLLLPDSPPWRVVFQSFFNLSGLFGQLKKKNISFFPVSLQPSLGRGKQAQKDGNALGQKI